MSATQQLQSDSLDDMRAALDRAMALIFILNDRVTALEAERGASPDAANLPKWMTLKGAAGLSGYTESGLRRRIAAGQVRSVKRGGHVLVDPGSLARKND